MRFLYNALVTIAVLAACVFICTLLGSALFFAAGWISGISFDRFQEPYRLGGALGFLGGVWVAWNVLLQMLDDMAQGRKP